MTKGPISQFIKHNYRHFNSAALVDAAIGYDEFITEGNKMMVTLGGAMSTAEMGISLAKMIREDKVHLIVCTGANLEEDVFNLVAHNYYERVPGYRYLSADDEQDLHSRHLNRVTDTCIPEEEAMRRIEAVILREWQDADQKGERFFPHEFFFNMLNRGKLRQHYEIPVKDSWLMAAAEKNIPVVVPGWEDSSVGNMFVCAVKRGDVKNISTVKSGLEYMDWLIDFYLEATKECEMGMFQIGGGISGDFPICVVPTINQDMVSIEDRDKGIEVTAKLWGYFCQISDSTTSYGSYSGAVPNEKITWGKLHKDTKRTYVVESDATIVAPLIFAYVLGE